jgi:hypothetical protein
VSKLVHAVLDFAEALNRETGEEADRIVLPRRAFDMLRKEILDGLEGEEVFDEPISGVGKDGRLWLACTELVADDGPPVAEISEDEMQACLDAGDLPGTPSEVRAIEKAFAFGLLRGAKK